MMSDRMLSPGSQEAVDKGCLCPVMDNAHGAGIGGDGIRFGWWINEECPLHGSKFMVSNPPVTGKEKKSFGID